MIGRILLTRDAFREGVFARDGGKCVMCGAPAQDAHHIYERRLWPDGGYYMDNGASVCGGCHLLAEATQITPEQLRAAAGIAKRILPPDLYEEYVYDKWGNIIQEDGTRLRGPLFYDESVQVVLRAVRHLYADRTKYPRTWHLPWSHPNDDDRVLATVQPLWLAGRDVVVTEKMDGEQTTMYCDFIHARSVDSKSHPSRDWVKRLHAEVGWNIPAGWRVCGENLYAKHAVAYSALPSYFLVFGIFDEKNVCLSWRDTEMWAELLGLSTVPVLYRGAWSESAVRACFTGSSRCGGEQEGYVVRVADAFPLMDFPKSVAKFVRPGHVQPSSHNWFAQPVVPNALTSR